MMRRQGPAITWLLVVVLAGCTTPVSVDYLTLTGLSQSVVRNDAAPVRLGPVTLPDYLKRNGLATRDSEGALHYSATQLWAEPLDGAIQRRLVEVLSDALGNTPVLAFPGLSSIDTSYRVSVSVRRLQATTSSVEMAATWRILPAPPKEADSVPTGSFQGERKLVSASGPAVARGFSELVHALALEIARAIPAQDD